MTETSPPSAKGQALLHDNDYLNEIRPAMLKFATLQLSDPHQAEDAVQEAFIGALKNADSFDNRAALKTWVFAILKYKIADILRFRQKQDQHLIASDHDNDSDNEEGNFDHLFDQRGHWQEQSRPSKWGNPESSFQQGQFWLIFDACLNHLPEKQSRIFAMREFIGLSGEEICKETELSTTNVNVILHRARMGLRQCLENNWFGKAETPC